MHRRALDCTTGSCLRAKVRLLQNRRSHRTRREPSVALDVPPRLDLVETPAARRVRATSDPARSTAGQSRAWKFGPWNWCPPSWPLGRQYHRGRRRDRMVAIGGKSQQPDTDDTYLQADIVPISSKVAGYVREVPVKDYERVSAGQLLAQIEDRDYRWAVAQSTAMPLDSDPIQFCRPAGVVESSNGQTPRSNFSMRRPLS